MNLTEELMKLTRDAAVNIAVDSITQFEELLGKMLTSAEKLKNDSPDGLMNAKLRLLLLNMKHFNNFDLASLCSVLMFKLLEAREGKSNDESQA